MGRRKGVRITGTLSPSATTRCFCSVSTATASPPRCGPATCRAPTAGTTCSCRRLNGSRRRARAWRSARTRRSPSRRSRDARETRRGLCHPHAGEQELGAGNRKHPLSSARTAEPQALGALQEFPLSGEELDYAQTGVAKVEHHRGELFPRVGFIVTNMTLPSRSVVRFYNKRGTAEPGSRKASRQRTGRGCRAIGSGRTKCACT